MNNNAGNNNGSWNTNANANNTGGGWPRQQGKKKKGSQGWTRYSGTSNSRGGTTNMRGCPDNVVNYNGKIYCWTHGADFAHGGT